MLAFLAPLVENVGWLTCYAPVFVCVAPRTTALPEARVTTLPDKLSTWRGRSILRTRVYKGSLAVTLPSCRRSPQSTDSCGGLRWEQRSDSMRDASLKCLNDLFFCFVQKSEEVDAQTRSFFDDFRNGRAYDTMQYMCVRCIGAWHPCALPGTHDPPLLALRL